MFEAEESKAIGDDHIACANHRIVAQSLTQHLVIERNIRSLALDQDVRLGTLVYHYNIGSLTQTIDIDGILLRDTQGGDALRCNQPPHSVTTHPLLGSEYKPLLAQRIPDEFAALVDLDAWRNIGEYQFYGVWHSVFLQKVLSLPQRYEKL